MGATPSQVASEILDVIPSVMREVRELMRSHRTADLSVTQFRVLAFVDRHSGTSLSAVAEHIGLTLPSMSKLMDGLVERKLIVREFDRADRRRVTLKLTARGRTILEAARKATRDHLTHVLSTLDKAHLETVYQALATLRPLFLSPREAHLVLESKDNGNS